MRLVYDDTLHAKLSSALEGEMEMVYKRIPTRTTLVSQLTRHTDILVGSTVEKFAKIFLAESLSTLTGKRSQTGINLHYMTLMLICVIRERLDWLKRKPMKSERLTTRLRPESKQRRNTASARM